MGRWNFVSGIEVYTFSVFEWVDGNSRSEKGGIFVESVFSFSVFECVLN